MRSFWNEELVDVERHDAQDSSALVTSETGIGVLVFLCRHPHQAVSADRVAALLDRDPEKVRGSLGAFCARGLAVVYLGSHGEELYRLSPVPAVWSLAAAHLNSAA